MRVIPYAVSVSFRQQIFFSNFIHDPSSMNILVLNSGSSSVKFQVIDTDLDHITTNTDRRLVQGVIERIGSEALITFRVTQADGSIHTHRTTSALRDHKVAIDYVIKRLIDPETGIQGIRSLDDIHAAGHRIVHGGEALTSSTLIDNDVLQKIEDCIELAPLHNPQNLKGYYAVKEIFGVSLAQVAVFDTAFHHTMPETSYLYAIPYQFYRRHKIRRYGFHGASHRYVAYRYRTLLNIERDEVNIISVHLGNGCSVCAVKSGNSYDTSMGMTPLEGLMMGTRSGDIDPAVIEYLCHKEGYKLHEVQGVLNKQSGLLGVSGLTNDMRELVAEAVENDDRRAKLAIDLFCYRVRKYIGAYLAAMNGAAAVVFTGGIGENTTFVREKVCGDMAWFGLELDHEANRLVVGGKEGQISTPTSRLAAWVIPTNEELLIARDTYRCVTGQW
jgi:acetate kinase